MHRIAQIGAGRMGSVHLRNAAAHPALDLAFVVDPRPDVAEVAAGVGARPARLEDVLADPSVEGVIVASSTDAHLDHALAALDAGKAVFCEKPLDLDARRLRAFESVLARPAAPLFVAFNRRFDPHFRALKAKLDGGEVGELETLQIVNHDPAAPPAHFLPTSGGLFKDFTIHDFDMAGWLMPDAPTEIFAWASCLVDPAIAEVGDVDTARVMLKDARGRLCVISNTRRSGCGYDQRIEAFGSKGMAVAGDLVQDTVQVWREDGARGAALHPGFMARYAEAYAGEMAHFADILAGTAAPETGYDASLRSLELAEAAAESARAGAPVRL
ncbi:Gfo/Idh/MocA family oxidoreductase [Phenylobacterium sp.]|uniref:Gfo/Idh/MocA family protein n=1 Tax=Phenylobacterium sp. TaxID=1871053 RepID=UPI0025DA07A1|nr:Gfo/Idh/MocA family oxidoreductase [Phenylobacterium sp.]MBX3484110.1 Gfo/Idh/MocA family oxidoreductase [Phenylobacterium sp.]MCW5759633.1 Gfo/Idh/MocA family oxidoreductase [Phenylobacterium sp.]